MRSSSIHIYLKEKDRSELQFVKDLLGENSLSSTFKKAIHLIVKIKQGKDLANFLHLK